MARKLNKALEEVLSEQAMPAVLPYNQDMRDEAESLPKYHTRRFSSGIEMTQSDEAEEPMDKVLIAIQHHFINGNFEKASELLNTFRGAKRGKFFTWHHMNQLMDWIRNIYKYTNMKDLSRNYYEHEMAKDMEIQGVKDLTKVRVKDETIEKFMQDAEKVLKRKLQMR
jgi:hypothetical protein